MTTEPENSIISGYHMGVSLESLSSKFNVSIEDIKSIVGIVKKKTLKKLSDNDIKIIRKRYKAGVSPSHLAAEFKISRQWLHILVKNLKNHRTLLSPLQKLDMKERHFQGQSYEEIGKIHKVHPKTVYKVLKGMK